MIDLPSDANAGRVKSAIRVLDLFEFLARWGAVKTHTEIALELGIPKSSLTHLLRTLVARKYLSYSPETKGYSLGPALSELARAPTEVHDLLAVAEPALGLLSQTTRETSALNVLRGDNSEVVKVKVGSHRLLFTMQAGDLAPLHATSGGKALLAFLPEEMRDDYVARTVFRPITPNTIVDPGVLKAQLDAVRATGVARVFEEFTPGVIGIARPVLGQAGFAIASVNIAMPRTRYNSDFDAFCAQQIAQCVEMITSSAVTAGRAHSAIAARQGQ